MRNWGAVLNQLLITFEDRMPSDAQIPQISQ